MVTFSNMGRRYELVSIFKAYQLFKTTKTFPQFLRNELSKTEIAGIPPSLQSFFEDFTSTRAPSITLWQIKRKAVLIMNICNQLQEIACSILVS